MRRARDQSEQGHREGQCRKRSRSHKGHNRGALTCLCYGLLLTCPKRIWMSEGAATRGEAGGRVTVNCGTHTATDNEVRV